MRKLLLGLIYFGIASFSMAERVQIQLPHPESKLYVGDRFIGSGERVQHWDGKAGRHWLTVVWRGISRNKLVRLAGTDEKYEVAFSGSDFVIPQESSVFELIRLAKNYYLPIDPQWRNKQKQVLGKSLLDLEQWFKKSKKERLWKKHMHWEAVQNELKKGIGADPLVFHYSARKLFLDIEGIEAAPVLSARRELLNYRDALEIGGIANKQGEYLNKLQELESAYKELSEDPVNAYAAADVGERLGWLERTHQVPWLVHRIRSEFNQANSRLDISGQYLSQVLSGDIDKKGNIKTEFDGGKARGTSRLEGKTSIRLIPNAKRAEFEIEVNGRLKSNSVWSKELVSAIINADYDVCLSRKFYMETDGVVGGNAMVSKCEKMSQVLRPIFNSVLPVAQREAYKKIREQVNKGSEKATKRVKEGLKENFEKELPEEFSKLDASYQQNIRNLYLRIGQSPKKMVWSTTANYLQNKQWRWGVGQIGSAQKAPKMRKDWDFVFRLHQSDLNNIFEPYFSGHTWSDRDLKEVHNEILGIVPPQLQIGQHMKAWDMTFTRSKPYVVEFRNNKLFMHWRVDKFRIQKKPGDGKEYITHNRPVQLTAKYDLRAPIADEEDYGPTGLRIGDVLIKNLNPKAPLPKDFHSFLEKKFNDVLPKKLQFFGLVPPEGGQFDPLLYLNLKEFRTEDGWALFGWRYLPE